MAESKKGTSAPADSKESSSFDGDFGKDFLSSWKSSKTGKDQINFDVESAPRNKQKTFNFDKLDDFELGGDFDKLSSFKMDMPDLDFSSPLKKTEKTKGKFSEETVQGKKDAKQDKFSFTFNFNELDNFDLDSNLLKGEEKTKKCIDDIGPDCFTKHDKDNDIKSSMHDENQQSVTHDKSQHLRSNSAIRTHVSEDNETKRFPVLESEEISRSEHLIDPNNADCAGPTTLDCGRQDVSRETVTSTENQMILVGENEKAMHSKIGNKQQSDGSCFLKKYPGNALPKFSVLSVSGDSSAQEVLPQIKKGIASLDHVKADSARELGDTARSISSSHSQNSSPANSYNSKCRRRASNTESPTSTGDSKKVQGNPSGATNGSTVPSESAKCHQDVDNVCATNFTQNYVSPSNFSSDKQNSCPKLLPSPLHRGSMLVKSMSVNENAVTAQQLNPLSKTEPQLTPAPTAKQLFSVDSGKRKSLTPFPGYANRESIQNAEAEVGDQKSQDKSSAKEICPVPGSGENDKSDPSHVQLPPSGLSGQITATSTVKNILPSPFSATATKKSLQNISVEKQDISLKDGKKHDIPTLRFSGITKSNIKISNFTMQKETRPVRFIERKQEVPLSTVSRISSSASAKKFALPSPSLKRKMFEESKTDLESLNPLKRVMESTTQRRGSLEVSPTINKKLEVSSTFDKNMVLGTGNPEAHQGNVSMDSIAYSSCVPEMKNVADIELPVLIENDGNVEKAEACAKELDDICNMLRKKNEEAKELLVRSVVNNNALMMLNHPMYDEKIRALQKRFASLQSREL